ncbi:MAG TPA: hypothetical protein VM616_03170 [Gammaproteobacteria bacterium]|nr:hypothetical protein [Gammaproteobacteria bacterium]
MSAARAAAPGRTRVCPHCKATILESADVCPGCRHHLRFNPATQQQPAARSAFRVDGTIQHPAHEQPWEYCIVVTVRNGKGEEVARNVVDVGALQRAEQRTFELSVDVLPANGPRANGGG